MTSHQLSQEKLINKIVESSDKSQNGSSNSNLNRLSNQEEAPSISQLAA